MKWSPLRTAARLALLAACLIAPRLPAAEAPIDIDAPPHRYRERLPQDRFTRFKAQLESGATVLDRSSELAFVRSLLAALDVPVESQLLVFSTTSLQLSLISPSNPRALYFNEDIYIGWVPGGKVEIIAVDPDLGGIFYIFDIPRRDQSIRVERSGRCMNCHAAEETGHVPGLVAKSVVPGPSGGSLTAHRIGQTGHAIPLAERFGGWHVTGAGAVTNHWGNLTGRFKDGTLVRIPNPPGERFQFNRYPVATSDLLAHLLHEHQAGFVNRVVEGTYLARQIAGDTNRPLSDVVIAELDRHAGIITRYLLFADEAPLPAGGVPGDPALVETFRKNRRAVAGAGSLKDLDLKIRLLRLRCSYMIYSAAFTGLPPVLKNRIYRRLDRALRGMDPDFAYLDARERGEIQRILRGTLADLPPGW